jgi:ABC-type polysaccharide/polyol phosphate transport system ATPase subunit
MPSGSELTEHGPSFEDPLAYDDDLVIDDVDGDDDAPWFDDDDDDVDLGELDDVDIEPAVRVDDLWVSYRTNVEQFASFKDRMRNGQRYRASTTVEALRGVSFDVPAGSVYGVIGHNGAGKSTLFRTIAGILPPSKGRVSVGGRVTPLMSLGVGFNSELSGRENILIGGLATGLHAEEIMDHYDEVVRFAELGDALDYPMKTYSSGMYARLGFAVASHLNPDILLIDEALSAGDARFKKRCTDKLVDLCGHDCTVMIISHGLSLITMLAERAVWLEQGQVVDEGPAEEVVDAYLNSDDLAGDEPEVLEDF